MGGVNDPRTERPIPPMRRNDGWQDVPLEPRDEPLVPVAEAGDRIVDRAEYHRWGLLGAMPRSWVREDVAARLGRVAQSLPDGMTLVVWDGFRPLAVQGRLFDNYLYELAAVHPEMPADALEEAASRYVSRPSRSIHHPPPHLTGGAVDLTLGDADGEPLDLGTPFDAFVPEAGAHALEDVPGPQRDLRRLLHWGMHDQGFTNYSEEWWHFDHGNQFWGRVTGNTAVYGPMDAPE